MREFWLPSPELQDDLAYLYISSVSVHSLFDSLSLQTHTQYFFTVTSTHPSVMSLCCPLSTFSLAIYSSSFFFLVNVELTESLN